MVRAGHFFLSAINCSEVSFKEKAPRLAEQGWQQRGACRLPGASLENLTQGA